MKKTILLLTLFTMSSLQASEFETEAKALSQRLMSSLQTQLQKAVQEKGVVEAIDFCHLEAAPIARNAAGEDLQKFSFGRTSHKIRNTQNAPQAWHQEYLEHFQSTGSKEIIVGKLKDGRDFAIQPLYTQAQCLMCHGETLAAPVQKKITELYPKDQATGFKLNDFRGFLWITTKN